MAVKVPELLLPAHLTGFLANLDHYVDMAVSVLRRRYYENASIKILPSTAIQAAMSRAEQRAGGLKTKVKNQIKAMTLENTLGMHRADPHPVTYLNISHSTIANFNLGPSSAI